MSPIDHYKGTQGATQSAFIHYPYTLGPWQSNEKLQVAKPELSLNLLDPLFGWPATKRYTNQANL